MPNEDVKFSELPVGTLASDSIFATSENDGNGGLISTGVSAADVGNFAIDNLQYPLKLNTENKKVAGAINELHAINGYSYDAYDDTATYTVGDLCIYNNALYKCTTAITTAEAWNASHWTATSIAVEISELLSDIGDNSSDIANIITNLGGMKAKTYTVEGNGGLLTLPSYNNVCLIFIGRGEGGLYFGHWTGVTPIVTASNHNVIYYSNPSRINVTNNTGSTDMVLVLSN